MTSMQTRLRDDFSYSENKDLYETYDEYVYSYGVYEDIETIENNMKK